MLKKVLASGVRVFLIDDLSPEDLAMCMALYARSGESVEVHYEKVMKERRRALSRALSPWDYPDGVDVEPESAIVGTVMDVWGDNHPTDRTEKLGQKWVVGYGHRSIADNGYTALFFEGVSMLAAKAIQDTPLYNGQEMSSRAVDCGEQPYVDPVGTPESRAVLEGWRALYRRCLLAAVDETMVRHPRREPEEDLGQYNRAVNMRAFDVARAMLPFGCATQVGWSGTLRHVGERLGVLKHHPSAEVRALAEVAIELCHGRYPGSGFGDAVASGVGLLNEPTEGAMARDAWTALAASLVTYRPELGRPLKESVCYDFGEMKSGWLGSPDPDLGEGEQAFTEKARDLLQLRPRGALLPWSLTKYGLADFEFPLDMGSWRDLQRQRAMVVPTPLLTADLGFEPWYLDQLPAPGGDKRAGSLGDIGAEVTALLHRAKAVTDDPVERQYYLPLGARVRARVSAGLPGLVYFLELRTGKTVHPTLRARALEMARAFRLGFPDVAIHVDEDPDGWSLRRGAATLAERVKVVE